VGARLTCAALAVALGLSGGAAARPGERVGEAGVTVWLPSGWHALASSDGGVEPKTRLAVSSGPARARRSPCQIARYAPRPDGVSLVVVEWTDLVDAPAPPRPRRVTERDLPLQAPPAIECFDGAGGSLQFADGGRVFGAYVLLGRRAPARLAAAARGVLATLAVETRPAKLVQLAPKRRAHCRKAVLLRPACPRLVPRVPWYLSHLAQDLIPNRRLAVFSLEHGVEHPMRPEHNRPPRMAHLVLLAGAIEQSAVGAFATPRAVRLHNGLLRRERTRPLSFGRVRWSGRSGTLLLAPPYLRGGVVGNHLIFRWRSRGTDYAVTLHAWEPLAEAVATLRAVVASTPAPPS
jgi:hypothetical protein